MYVLPITPGVTAVVRRYVVFVVVNTASKIKNVGTVVVVDAGWIEHGLGRSISSSIRHELVEAVEEGLEAFVAGGKTVPRIPVIGAVDIVVAVNVVIFVAVGRSIVILVIIFNWKEACLDCTILDD